MGSYVELNDTLRISKEQGFPVELDLLRHLETPIEFAEVEGRTFNFTDKEAIRVYQQPPVRNFLVEDVNGKWVYWGKCEIVTINHDYITKKTSGTFRIISLNNPEQMKQAFELIDRVPENNYFS